jgi:hypothetical protein
MQFTAMNTASCVQSPAAAHPLHAFALSAASAQRVVGAIVAVPAGVAVMGCGVGC